MGKNTVDKVLRVAEAEVGYVEKSKSAYQKDNSILYDKILGAGSDNYTKYGKEMHDVYPAVMDFPAYWCDCFVDWCFYKAYGIANAKALLGGNFDDYTVASARLYKNKDAYYKKSPQAGDQIFFNNGTKICHTGIVYAVDNKYVYTIEGNTSGGSSVVANGGSVAKKRYELTNPRIDGYGRPKYDKEEEKKDPKASTATTAAKKTTYKGEFPTSTLRRGAISKDVKRLQQFLNWYSNFNLKVDGDFGPKTKAAVQTFQRKEGLVADGIFGAKSLAVAKKVKR